MFCEQESKGLVQSSPGVGMIGCRSKMFHNYAEIVKLDLLCGRTSGS